MTWQAASDVAAKVVNANSRGCRDCGHIQNFRTEHGFLAYYPGVECCPPALRRQIEWRHKDIDRINRQIQERQDRATELRRQAERAPTHNAKANAEAEAARAERSLHMIIRDHYTPQLQELSKEVARLKRKLAALRPENLVPHEALQLEGTP